ncbi:hypothetical protein NDI85_09525 [Halomicroarcula sp. S1AR25-4]|uniref:hypothetical protein n=1 Tax=Haloarcula sp. S1AR25-4 TaxID=2950538 RepID=UPI002874D822|nr:hypothetical protein [Halomicroarcula sp. S1AR25-4]MDS0278034.1 hypothetical protein [Halomicroarcula sp. S1AR25-4]
MTRAIWVARSSQGSADKLSLTMQREECKEQAERLADDVAALDLGITTGFSSLVKPNSESRIDNHEEHLQFVEDLHAGEYDYVVAYNPSRIARDEYWFEVRRAAILGDAEFVFLDEKIPDDVDDYSFTVTQVVEAGVKRREFTQSAKAKARREEEGLPDGRPPRGMRYNDDATAHVPDKETFPGVLEVVARLQAEVPYSTIVDETGVGKGSITGIKNRLDYYLDMADEHGYDLPEVEAGAKS